MMMAQRLYEAGHITYMRTDSTNLSAEAVGACRMLIQSEFGEKYLPSSPNLYGSKEGAQEAHEAIRPSNVGVKSAILIRCRQRRNTPLRVDLESVCRLSNGAC